MIDIHTHIIPGIDDGARNLKASLKMAEIAIKDGIVTMVATPHILDYPLSMEKINKKLKKLEEAFKSHGLNLELFAGAEVSPFAVTQMNNPKDYTINNSRYLLLEFPYLNIPDYLHDILFNLCAKGIVPILAHPERNSEITKEPWKIEEFLKNEILIQITAASITGELGKSIKRCAEYMLENSLVNIVASDAHSTRRRPPLLSEAYHCVKDEYGRKRADILFKLNPSAIVHNNEVI